jgi:hypothetical protein
MNALPKQDVVRVIALAQGEGLLFSSKLGNQFLGLFNG